MAASPVAGTPAHPSSESRGPGPWILLAEDERLFRTLVRQQLERAGYRVVEARNGLDLLVHLSDPAAEPAPEQIDLVLSDVRMPMLSGLEVVCALRHEHPLPPVILITGAADSRLRSEARRAGVLAVLEKPFEFGQLFATIRDALSPAPNTHPSPSLSPTANLSIM